jgi:hypothetical protein
MSFDKLEQLTRFSAPEILEELRAREQASHDDVNNQLSAFTPAMLAQVLRDKEKGIYGVDDRKDLFEVTDPDILRDADSVVVLVDPGLVIDNGNGTSTIIGTTLGALKRLCTTERFREQLSAGFGSGFLVAPDIIATAGHNIPSGDLNNIRFIFGFRMVNETTLNDTIPNGDIYIGKEIIASETVRDGADWALIRLTASVTNHRVVTIRRHGKINDSESVHVIGHPVGLPAKFADGAVVRRNVDASFFVANLDTYGGNSGSPVFNSGDHVVEGILVRGETDFVQSGTCKVSRVCPTTGCLGESVTRTTEFAIHVPDK